MAEQGSTREGSITMPRVPLNASRNAPPISRARPPKTVGYHVKGTRLVEGQLYDGRQDFESRSSRLIEYPRHPHQQLSTHAVCESRTAKGVTKTELPLWNRFISSQSPHVPHALVHADTVRRNLPTDSPPHGQGADHGPPEREGESEVES
ncbi:hypothetical protein B2J93_6750 [Marssonina coronariae]|uniref:Uncharacterized protein n=1 Tax=Diplocarpon coronariae TaxID=2795749 RepID=A0A218ZHT7_9HELO|nr:hypothetical protein B2J93_6750 [Marssonina coronariae]